MIIGFELSLDKIQNILHQMHSHAKFNFILTGSRFFGHANINSDYDFFVQSHKSDSDYINDYSQYELVDFLTKLGFYKHIESSYLDNNTGDVYRYVPDKCSPIWIDVQIVYDAELKEKIQNKLKYYGWIMPKDKLSRILMWNLCYLMMS